jgi:hypothetical protein
MPGLHDKSTNPDAELPVVIHCVAASRRTAAEASELSVCPPGQKRSDSLDRIRWTAGRDNHLSLSRPPRDRAFASTPHAPVQICSDGDTDVTADPLLN